MKKTVYLIPALTLSILSIAGAAQQPALGPVVKSMHSVRLPYYVDAAILTPGILLLPPPAVGSPANDSELAELHRIERSRTADQVAKAEADDKEEDIFIFRSVLGPAFSPDTLPITAALGAHVKNEEGAIGTQIKRIFARPRPYQIDATLHPVCKLDKAANAYPSGHALSGYLEAFTLIQLLPEKHDAILARADEYASERLVCGVHYRSDIEASRRMAYVVFGYMLATPRFQRDLEAARSELRSALGLPVTVTSKAAGTQSQ